MNILLYEKGPYSTSKFEYGKTRTVLVELEHNVLRIRFTTVNLPYKKLHGEEIEKRIDYMGEPMHIDLTTASLLSLPHDLSKKRCSD